MTLKDIANNLQKENLSAERVFVAGLSLSVVLSIVAFVFQNDMAFLFLFLIIAFFVAFILANRLFIRDISAISDPPPSLWRNCFGWLKRKK